MTELQIDKTTYSVLRENEKKESLR